jgi:hypothetical protein
MNKLESLAILRAGSPERQQKAQPESLRPGLWC